MNNIFQFIILGMSFVTLSACAIFSTREQQYSERILIKNTKDVCSEIKLVLSSANVQITDINPNDNYTAPQKSLPTQKVLIATKGMDFQGSRLNDLDLPVLHSYFCKYKYFFTGKKWDRAGGNTNYYFLNETKIADGFSNIFVPTPNLEAPYTLERLSAVVQTVNANRQLFIDNVSIVSAKKPINLSFNIKYPNTSGILKSEAKLLRKRHLEKEVGHIFEYLSYIPYVSQDVDSFLETKTPGPFKKGDLSEALNKFRSFRAKFNLDGVGAWVKPELYEYESNTTRAGFSDRDAHLSSLMNENFRRELFGFLLQAESKWDIKRISKSEVSVTVTIDIPAILKSYKFSNISDYTE